MAPRSRDLGKKNFRCPPRKRPPEMVLRSRHLKRNFRCPPRKRPSEVVLRSPDLGQRNLRCPSRIRPPEMVLRSRHLKRNFRCPPRKRPPEVLRRKLSPFPWYLAKILHFVRSVLDFLSTEHPELCDKANNFSSYAF
uniref:(northern house mosquito) hypothetical protein n=1 Tax=Culex pipiens TaxID=7175 RepID=A0A8D8KW70_CULPI